MKKHLSILILFTATNALSQQLELHYDFRGTVDPKRQQKNFPTFYFEYFGSKENGSTLFKLQSDLKGRRANMGQTFIQFSQSVKFWKPKIYLSAGYSGGLGVFEPSGGFYISNSYLLGVAYPFSGKNSWYSAAVTYKLAAFDKPSHDPQATFYFGKGLYNYKFIVSGSFVLWTQNRNQGTDFTAGLSGKEFNFFGDPQVWMRISGNFSGGLKIWLYYHVLTKEDTVLAYPSIGLKYKLE